MDNFHKGPKPQFNVTLFNYITSVTINKKMAGDLLIFIKSSPAFFEDYGDFYEDLHAVLNDEMELIASENGDYQISRYKNTITIHLEADCARVLGEFLLTDAKMCCDAQPFLNLGSFVAFGRRLRDAAMGNYTTPANPNKGPVREIVIRREIIR
jgi:hypothetical protein